MLGDSEVQDLALLVPDYEPGVEQPKSRRRHDEEVHRCDVVPVIPNERAPALALIAVWFSFWEISSDRGNPNEDPELLELRLNLPGAPAVLVGESLNECSHLGRNRRPTRAGLRDRAPVEPESSAMPSGHGVGLDDDDDVLPSRPDPRQQHPEASIGWCDAGSASLLGEGRELLAEGKFDDRLLASASKEGRDTSKGDRREFEQLPHCTTHSERVRHSVRD